ncbi:P-loop containing nucleoside triphosphate hydrolase protein [Cucurbitaria berberidis CBS 394.84]|uniref:RNA helicase n=1 Tax=Cucurbitaria berberidis CBS 394.84 TaxID=1168544 RepID=A0A9P4LBM3_9PLEO|nr:P-loop containing nucleoside triphosphate hydrolase protein [Cucurbitaria berberidis CBS 394.84]KAF1848329.1 P-loop containing nucleoside triphosphate hydrolase protein [Cucurbitaria berberidis CBS 394.84]
MAKKKKPAGNPARGFATTSVASKPKQEKAAADATAKEVAQTPSKENAAAPQLDTCNQASQDVEGPKQEVVQTPEEFEAQLERDELQLLVEKHAPKVRREANRHVSKFQTDRRVLRGQSHSMTVHDWLPGEILDSIVSLAQAESNDSNRRQGQQSLLKTLTEEDALCKLWALDLTLRDLGFSHDHIQPVLRWLCANAASIDTSANIWGLQEALEWLALDQCKGHSFSYEEANTKRSAIDTPDASRPVTPVPDTSINEALTQEMKDPKASKTPTSLVHTPSIPTPVDSESGDVYVSDLDSDLELDDLVPAYLRIKGKLFEIDPQLVDANSRKQTRGAKSRKPASMPNQSLAVRKLLSQLQQLTSDALFDEYEAEEQWPAKRNQIAQVQAAKRLEKESPPTANKKQHGNVPEIPIVLTEKEPILAVNTADVDGSEDDTDLLGAMFSAIPDQPVTKQPALDDINAENVVLRDFGKVSGVTPRKVLEEAVRSRDPNARLTYQMVSPTAYSCRHSLTITWSKDHDVEYDEDIIGVTCSVRNRQAKYVATTTATISIDQSENYVSTAALFSISATSTKEEKVYLRLPSNWRELYREFLEHRRTRLDAADREAIKHYRSIIQDQIETEESDGVVLTSRFKMRNQVATSSSASNSGYSTPVRQVDGLRELWAQKASTPAYQHMLAGRANLPVFGFRESILSTVDKNQVTIICGETGCGKSTQIPSFILEHELLQGKTCKVFCTEPRRISAISLAQRVSEEMGEGPKDLGTPRSLVGYAIRLESKTSSQTRLVYATVGVVLRMLESSGGLQEVTHLVIDEVHERSIDTDFLLIILRSLMARRPELKVILMSATVDAARFSRYLNNAPILTVPGRTFPVQTRYLEDAIELTHYAGAPGTSKNANTSDNDDDDEITTDKSGIPTKLPGYSPATREALSQYNEYAIDYDLVLRLIESVAFDPQLSRFSHAVLVFLPGIAEIRQLNDILVSHPSFDANWFIYPLHSTISSEDQQAAFLIPPPGVRKIVLATNIAETGVTIPDITCVIDTGKHKEMRFDERRQLSRLTQSFISRANAKQRRGRAGRVQEGLCFHLFTRYRHDNIMAEQQTPEMLRLSLQDLVMRTKICKLGDIEATLAQALDPPSSRNIRRAIDALIEVDALTPGEDLTPLGRQIAKLPLDAHLGKLVLLASTFACLDVAITIAAILSSKSPFVTPFGAKQRADIARLAFKKGDSDLLTTYNAYKTWRGICTTPGRSEMQFCHKNFLSPQNLGNIEDLKAQLLSSLVEAGFVQLSLEERRALGRYRSTTRHRTFVEVPTQYDIHTDNDILVNSVIATAFYPKILTREGKGWRNISNNQTVSLAPTSVNKGSSTAKFLSYYHIMQSSNKFYNAHSTSLAHPLPMVLMVAADMDFKLHAGVISLPGNVLRFAVRDWRAAVALKVLRRRVKEILANSWKNPARQLSEREKEWLALFYRVFEERFEKDERIRERAGGKGK